MVWAWRSPLRYRSPETAMLQAETMHKQLGRGRAWVVAHEDGSWRPVWGGYLTRDALFQEMPTPPVPDAAAVPVPGEGANPEGTIANMRMREENGVASLRNIARHGRIASEFWWRYVPMPQGVRLAGPWGLDGAATAGSVDTPGDGP